MAITSKKINLEQLDAELGGKGLIADFNNDKKKLILASENSNVSEAELEAAIAAHIAIDVEAIKLAEKATLLAKLGIDESDLKTLLS